MAKPKRPAVSCWLITRPREDSEAVARALAERGHRSIIAPILEIDTTDAAVPDLADVQALLFTSANGARAFARISARRDIAVLAVGDATAAAAREAGFAAVESAAGDVEDLARLAATSLSPTNGPLLHVAGTHRAGDLQARLEAAGFSVRRAVLYTARAATVLPPAATDALAMVGLTGVVFFSPRTAAEFDSLVRAAGLADRLAGLTAMCLSQAVAARLESADWGELAVAARPELPALLALIDATG
ncbi:MAG: uroporphyrinogen-III synthase [Inquilinus sp.]|nr:uroporphyrinogen-III synthase [Inquilinus sp.]